MSRSFALCDGKSRVSTCRSRQLPRPSRYYQRYADAWLMPHASLRDFDDLFLADAHGGD